MKYPRYFLKTQANNSRVRQTHKRTLAKIGRISKPDLSTLRFQLQDTVLLFGAVLLLDPVQRPSEIFWGFGPNVHSFIWYKS